MAKSIRDEGETRPRPQGPELHGSRRGPLLQQERAAPQLQPRAQEGSRAHPQRRRGVRVRDHHAVHRRGVRRRRPLPPPVGPPRARRRSLLGLLHRRQARDPVGAVVQGHDGGGEIRGARAGVRRGGCPGRSPAGVLQGGEGRLLLRWRARRARGHHAGEPAHVGARGRGDVRDQDLRPSQDPAPGRVGGALRRARRRQGRPPGRWQDGRVQDEAGTGSRCRRRSFRS